MDDRGYLVEALLERLSADGVAHRVLGNDDGQVNIVVPHALLGDMPRAVARFGQEFDLRLVQMLRPAYRAWRFVLGWSDDVGRPRFIAVTACSDWYGGTRRLLRAEELLRGAPHTLFIHGLLDAVDRQVLHAEAAARLSVLWHEDPSASEERVARYWRRSAHIRLIAQAARHGDWTEVRSAFPALRRALRWSSRPVLDAVLERLGTLARRAVEPAAVIAFVARNSAARKPVMEVVKRDLHAAFHSGLETVAYGFEDEDHAGADIRVVFDNPAHASGFEDAVAVESSKPLAVTVAEIERVVLRWLECRVEHRHPDALIGDNPFAARLLQFACRHRVPVLAALVRTVLNCGIYCRIRTPILMPHPFGIVIDRGVSIGSRVTIMQQASIGPKRPSDPGLPVIEDNVFIGPGAKVLGPVRVGRGATVGANAVVTRDVPSHCTVVGVNRILGQERRKAVVKERRGDEESVVNT
jgi:serine O-acetyltransferase